MQLGNWEWAHIATGALASMIFLYQTFGSANSDTDFDADAGGASDVPADPGSGDAGTGQALSDFLSVRNFVAFFMGYGWVTLAASLSGNSRIFSSAVGSVSGVIFVLASFFLLKTFLNFQEDGTLNLESLTGGHASVYIIVASKMSAIGKVLVDTKAGRVELPARTRDEEPIRPGSMVKILGAEGGVLWVTAKEE